MACGVDPIDDAGRNPGYLIKDTLRLSSPSAPRMNIGLECTYTCEDAEMFEFPCVHCGTVGSEDGAWGSVKAQYR